METFAKSELEKRTKIQILVKVSKIEPVKRAKIQILLIFLKVTKPRENSNLL